MHVAFPMLMTSSRASGSASGGCVSTSPMIGMRWALVPLPPRGRLRPYRLLFRPLLHPHLSRV
ncbi:hypothetical protein BHE74_00039055 [Ensete ventricosum]|nr:hypothetical protein BHE74_00039055 [Ensete ventricosum]RZS14070.1 hypothetical protein BHM03_00045739 [Ensete ventricosum]